MFSPGEGFNVKISITVIVEQKKNCSQWRVQDVARPKEKFIHAFTWFGRFSM